MLDWYADRIDDASSLAQYAKRLNRIGTLASSIIGWVLLPACAAFGFQSARATALLPPYIEEARSIRLLPTRLDSIRLPLRQGEITAILPTAGVLWVGTTNGLFLFDGVSGTQPKPQDGEIPTLYVKSLLALKDGTVLVGTINGSIWRASRERLEGLYEDHNRDEFQFLRAGDGEIYVAESFVRLRPERIRSLVHGETLRLLPGGFSRLAAFDKYIYAVRDSGGMVQFDVSHSEGSSQEIPERRLASPVNAYPRQFQVDHGGNLWITTDAGVQVFDPVSGASSMVTDGSCGGVGESRFGRIWIACTGRLMEFDGTWRTWLVDPTFGRGSTVASDEFGNLWLGGNGLWRAYQYARTLSMDDSVQKIARAGERSIWTVEKSGAVSLLQLDDLSSRQILAPTATKTALTVDHSGRAYAVHEHALWRLDDSAMLARTPGETDDVAIAVGVPGTFIAERGNSGRVWRLTDAGFVLESITIRSPSGSGAACIGIDRAERVWIASATQLFARLPTGKWLVSEEIPYAPETKLNRWAVFWLDHGDQPRIFGPWGYTMAVDVEADRVRTQRASAPGHDQPWLAIEVQPFDLVLGTDNGLFGLHDGRFLAAGAEDTRLRSPIWSLVSMDGSTFVAATQLGLVEVNMALQAPRLESSSVPASIPQRLLRVTTRAPGLAGPPDRAYTVAVSRAGGSESIRQESADGNFLFDDLNDATFYNLSVGVTNALGRRDPISTALLESTFHCQRSVGSRLYSPS
jgi:hypothetical protein